MKNIIIYTTSTWPHCHTAKAFLKSEGLKFTEKNVSNNQAYQKELVDLDARGVPTFKIDDEVIVGFDKNKIMSLIDYKVINCPNCSTRARVPKDKGKIKVTCKKCGEEFITKT